MGACRIRIVSRDNGVGLSRDMALMAEALQGEDARIERVGFGNGKGGNPRTAGPRVHAPNIDHRIGYLDDAELRRLQNAHAFHVCPSEVEGFGHYLMEAMSVGAVVLATDAEPMNELVPAFHGIPIPVYRSRLQGLVPHHYVAPAGIELAVETALGLTEGQRQRFAQRARTHFLATREAFHARFRHALGELARAPLVSMMAGSGAA